MDIKKKMMFIQFICAFIILMFFLSVMGIVAQLFKINWLITYTETGFFIGNIVGAMLGIYNIVVPLREKEIFKQLGAFFYFILLIGFFCFLVNAFHILEYLGIVLL